MPGEVAVRGDAMIRMPGSRAEILGERNGAGCETGSPLPRHDRRNSVSWRSGAQKAFGGRSPGKRVILKVLRTACAFDDASWIADYTPASTSRCTSPIEVH